MGFGACLWVAKGLGLFPIRAEGGFDFGPGLGGAGLGVCLGVGCFGDGRFWSATGGLARAKTGDTTGLGPVAPGAPMPMPMSGKGATGATGGAGLPSALGMARLAMKGEPPVAIMGATGTAGPAGLRDSRSMVMGAGGWAWSWTGATAACFAACFSARSCSRSRRRTPLARIWSVSLAIVSWCSSCGPVMAKRAWTCDLYLHLVKDVVELGSGFRHLLRDVGGDQVCAILLEAFCLHPPAQLYHLSARGQSTDDLLCAGTQDLQCTPTVHSIRRQGVFAPAGQSRSRCHSWCWDGDGDDARMGVWSG